ncbi:TonB-dependent receptor [Hyunsoonleella sp. SJ7]|uniref:TonB-dependent receptor n=1 Tax=Hyunsoonleella aquatilis TaxID=2762758 RepID=A0A923H965_9FLAO|nr:outer membrane beta-barrel protein [Hyunsoonleella aquatilis]MBC3758965.1 TonB-dependent receptor [Hyunsoonleella aquatilis]
MLLKYILLFFLFFSLSFYAQNFTLIGAINDESNMPVAFANVVLKPQKANGSVLGTITDDGGGFSFENLESGLYAVEISYLGFETYTKEVNLTLSTNLGVIILKQKAESLDGVTVTAKRPTVNRLVDRLVFNVENSTLSNNNALDVLKHTPGVIVQNGSISVKNTTPIVYINDRRVHLSIEEVQQLLEATPANNIKQIEVITNPPAKYEAEGGAVLNIATSKNLIAGYNGSIFGNYKQGPQFPKYSFGTSHFFKAKKLSAYLNYNISPRKDYHQNRELINFFENNSITSNWDTDYKRTRESANQNINANVDYNFDDYNSLNFSANTLIVPRENSKTGINSLTEIFNVNKQLDSTFQTFNNSVLETFNLAFSLGYTHKFKREGEQISVDLHHTNYDFSEFQDVNTGYFLPNASSSFRDNKFQTFTSQDIELMTGQIDYTLPISGSALFESGIKASFINSDNILNQFIFENGDRMEDQQNSDIFLYDEANYAGYVSFEKEWGKWSLKSGLRLEITDIESQSQSTNASNKNSYSNLFPSLYILHRMDNEDQVYFSYNRRIFRPRYRRLNPFRYFLNDNKFVTGDPNLQPEIDDNFILGYTIKNTYTIELYYRYERDPTLEITFQDNDERLIKQTYTNIDNNISYGLDFTTYKQIAKGWSLYVLSSLFYFENNFFALESNNELLKNEQWSLYARMVNYLNFLKDNSLNAEISLDYISKVVYGPTNVSERLGFDINLNKTFWNNRASLSIGVQDIFNTRNFTNTTRYLDQDVFVDSRMENRLFTVGFNYKFGNFRLKESKKDIEVKERDRLEFQ